MKVKFLIHVARDNKQLWIARCLAISKVSGAYCLREEATEDLRKQLILFNETQAKKYLSGWKGTTETINCPEGFVTLPVDFWKCKINRELCSIQCQVYIKDKEKFLAGCRVPKEKKEEIFNTVKNLKYEGFHHILGRYLCSLCSGKEYERYHYPWELTSLDKFFDLGCTEFRKTFLRANIGLAAYGSALCSRHIKEVVSKIDLNLEKEVEILGLNIFR